MKCGLSWRPITPEKPVMLDGFAARTAPHEGVIDDIYVRAVWLETGGGPLIIYVLDSTGLSSELRSFLLERISPALGISAQDVIFIATHTHYAPAGGLLRSVPVEWEYWETAADRMVEAAREARASTERCEVSVGKGRIDFSVNRRVSRTGAVEIGEDYGVDVDRGLDVVGLRGSDGNLRGLIADTACHPVSRFAGANRISSDYPAAFYDATVKVFDGCVPLFFNAGGADINPAKPSENPEEIYRNASSSLSRSVRSVLDRGLEPAGSDPVTRKRVELRIPVNDDHALQALSELQEGLEHRWTANAAFTRYMREWVLRRSEERNNGRLSKAVTAEADIVAAGDIVLVALPFEVMNETAANLKQQVVERHGRVPIIASYANDVAGYLPTRRMLQEGGYESLDAAAVYGLPGIYSLDAEERVVRDVCDALGQVLAPQ